MNEIGRYAKALVPVILGVIYGVQAALSDDKITNTEWLGIATIFLTAIGVLVVPNARQSDPDLGGKTLLVDPNHKLP